MKTISKNLESALIVDKEQIPEIVRAISDQVTQCAHLAIEEHRTIDVNNRSGREPNYPFHVEESIADGVTTTYVMHEQPGWEPSDGSPQYYEYMLIEEKDGKVTRIKLPGIEYLFDPDKNALNISARFPYGENSHSELNMTIDPQYAVLRESDQHLFLQSLFYTPKIIDGNVIFIPIGGGTGIWEDEVTISAVDAEKILPVSSFHYRPNFDTTWIFGTPIGIPNPEGKYGSLRKMNTAPNRPMNGIPLEYIVDLITRNMMYKYYIVDSRPYQTLATRLSQLYESNSIEYRPYEINVPTGQHKVSLYKWIKPDHRGLGYHSAMIAEWSKRLIKGDDEQYDEKYTAVVETKFGDKKKYTAYRITQEYESVKCKDDGREEVTIAVIIDGERYVYSYFDNPEYWEGLTPEEENRGFHEAILEALKAKFEKP